MALGTHPQSGLSPPVIAAAAVNVIYKVCTVFRAPCHFIIGATRQSLSILLPFLSEGIRNKAQRG